MLPESTFAKMVQRAAVRLALDLGHTMEALCTKAGPETARLAERALTAAEVPGVVASLEAYKGENRRLHAITEMQHKEIERLRDALKAGWTWGQFEWARSHLNELPEDLRLEPTR